MRLIIASLLFASSIAVFIFGVRPVWQDIGTLGAKKDTFSTTIERINELRRARDTLIQTYNSISQTDIRRVKKILPDTLNSGLILVELSNLASQSGFLLKSTDVSAAAGRSGAPVVRGANQRFAEVQLKLVVSGPYERFRSFLQNLEKNLRIIDVTSLSFTSPGQPSASVDFSIEAKSYTQP
ncbi:MAG: type 4a pilus biogenesis protein PilO [Candidatus Niyogibacteria bacterium]|nr:type 4a pilus biogenesis protein PilO [Candidatus Niyogibacteria bacterium]